MEEYKYSSYSAYLLGKKTILNKQEVLDWFDGLDSFIEHHKIMMEYKDMDKYLSSR